MCRVWGRKFQKVVQYLRCGLLVKYFLYTECNSTLTLYCLLWSSLFYRPVIKNLIKYHLSLTLRHLQAILITSEKNTMLNSEVWDLPSCVCEVIIDP